MCDLLRGFEREPKVVRRGVTPGINRLGARHPVERVVNLNAVQPGRVELQKLLVGEIFRIKAWPPFLVTEP